MSKTACVTFGPPSTCIGQIVDVTMEELTFLHAAVNGGPLDADELNILLPQHGFSLRDLPFEVISDEEVETNHVNIKPAKRCRVRFGALTEEQKAQLERFIQNHTTTNSE